MGPVARRSGTSSRTGAAITSMIGLAKGRYPGALTRSGDRLGADQSQGKDEGK